MYPDSVSEFYIRIQYQSLFISRFYFRIPYPVSGFVFSIRIPYPDFGFGFRICIQYADSMSGFRIPIPDSDIKFFYPNPYLQLCIRIWNLDYVSGFCIRIQYQSVFRNRIPDSVSVSGVKISFKGKVAWFYPDSCATQDFCLHFIPGFHELER